jgi:hypothetical protein
VQSFKRQSGPSFLFISESKLCRLAFTHIGYGVVSICGDLGIIFFLNAILMGFKVSRKSYFLTLLILFLILATAGEILNLLLLTTYYFSRIWNR